MEMDQAQRVHLKKRIIGLFGKYPDGIDMPWSNENTLEPDGFSSITLARHLRYYPWQEVWDILHSLKGLGILRIVDNRWMWVQR